MTFRNPENIRQTAIQSWLDGESKRFAVICRLVKVQHLT